MRNEWLLIGMVVLLYGAVLLWFRLFGKGGLIGFTVFATITANIEVLMLVDAFGMEMTLGNILFACTFLITDILSEVAGKQAARQAVYAGIATNLLFIIISQSWMLYQPAASDWATPSMRTIFANTPRLMLASVVVYVIAQLIDVTLYHKWWALTERLTGDHRRFLWLRNNGSTLLSQLINTVLYTLFAFWGMYDGATLGAIILSSYVIFIFTSLLDTPAVYLARRIAERQSVRDEQPAA